LAKCGLEEITPIGIDAEADAAFGQFGDIQYSAMVGFLKEDADLARVFVLYVVKEKDVERRAAYAIAVISPVMEANL
jgi:hypothetical protein